MSQTVLMSGNEALARGAYEAGVKVASGYPGTPSTEILENLVAYKADVHCEWAPNEKVAVEVAIGAAVTGVRALATMKHVGLNVAADPLMTGSYIGPKGGLVIIVADDPGMYSSQTEQDSRHYARLAKIPVLEPSDPREMHAFIKEAFVLSERYETPVLIRTTTAVAHSRAFVTLEDRLETRQAHFEKEPSHYVLVPNYARGRRVVIQERMTRLADGASESALNTVIERSAEIGVISSGTAALHCETYFPEASLLKLGWSFPFPDAAIRAFAARVKRLIVIEENEPFLEEHIRSLGLACEGKSLVPSIGELTPARIAEIRAKVLGLNAPVAKP